MTCGAMSGKRACADGAESGEAVLFLGPAPICDADKVIPASIAKAAPLDLRQKIFPMPLPKVPRDSTPNMPWEFTHLEMPEQTESVASREFHIRQIVRIAALLGSIQGVPHGSRGSS